MSGDLVAGRHGKPRQPLEETPQEYAAFKIEQRGIDLIPDAERKMRPSGPTPKRAMCSRSMATSSGGAGMRRDGLRVLVLGLPLVRPFRPRCSWPGRHRCTRGPRWGWRPR